MEQSQVYQNLPLAGRNTLQTIHAKIDDIYNNHHNSLPIMQQDDQHIFLPLIYLLFNLAMRPTRSSMPKRENECAVVCGKMVKIKCWMNVVFFVMRTENVS